MAPPRHPHPLLDDRQRPADTYAAMPSIAAVARHIGVSPSTVQRALQRHKIPAKPRSTRQRPSTVALLDDARWLTNRYRTRTGVEIAHELGVSPRTVYAAMDRHHIPRRTTPGTLALRQPALNDPQWLRAAVNRTSSTDVAARLGVSPGTVLHAYHNAGIDPTTTPAFFARGHPTPRPTPDTLRAIWETEQTHRGVARRLGIGHTTAAVWLAEIGIFATTTPAISKPDLEAAITNQHTLKQVAATHRVATHTVRIELLRHGLHTAHRTRHHQHPQQPPSTTTPTTPDLET